MLMKDKFNKGQSSPLSSRHGSTPEKLLAFLVLQIFLAETIAMTIIYFIQVPSYIINTLLDGALMLLILIPGLYFLQFKPLLLKIIEHEQAEQALRTSEAYKNKVIEVMPIGVWIVDKNGEIILGNIASQEIWAGIRYVGKNAYNEYKAVWAATGEPVKPDEWAAVRAITEGTTLIAEEINIEAFDGTKKTIINSAAPITDDKNTILGAVVINQDITQSKRMATEFARSNALLDRFFNSIHTMIVYLDRNFVFLRVNQAYANSAGHPVDYFIGKNHFDLYPHEENEAIFRQVVQTGKPFSITEKPFEYPEFPERGITYWDWSLQPVMGEDNQVEGLVFSLIDVTRRKMVELQLERQNQDLRDLTETERRQRVLAEGLVQSVIAVNSSLDLNRVLFEVLEQTRKVIPFQGADIILVEGDRWRVASFLGFEDFPATTPDLEISHTLGDYPLLQTVCASQQALVLDSIAEVSQWGPSPFPAWLLSFAAFPLVIENNTMGIVELYSERYAAFDQAAANQLFAIAAPAALAIHNARLYQAETEARRIAETMQAAAQALSQSLNLEQVINTLLDHIVMIVPCDTSGLTLMEGEDLWTLRALRGHNAWAGKENIPVAPVQENLMGSGDQIPEKVLTLNHETIPAGMRTDSTPDTINRWVILPILIKGQAIGYVELGKAGKDFFTPEQVRWAEALVLEACVAIQNAWLFEQVRAGSLRLQSLARKLVELQEKERYHIARELHDDAGQVLSSLKLNLGKLEQDVACPPHIRQGLQHVKKVVDTVLEDLHRLAMDLRPVALDHLGLVAALEQLTNQWNSEALTVKFVTLGMEGYRLPRDVETSLYRIVQEALTNVVNHASAQNVGILLERSAGCLKLFVEDDGVGFVPGQEQDGKNLGLVGMRERAEMLGGNLTIESSPGGGTSIIVEVPDGDTHPYYG